MNPYFLNVKENAVLSSELLLKPANSGKPSGKAAGCSGRPMLLGPRGRGGFQQMIGLMGT